MSRRQIARGGALVMAMIVITALSLMTIGFMAIATSTKHNTSNAIAREQAYRLAETALADYIQRANQPNIGGADKVISSVNGLITVNYLPNVMSYTIQWPGSSAIPYTDPGNPFGTPAIPSTTYQYYRVICYGTVMNQSGGNGGDSTGSVTRYIEAWVRSRPGPPASPTNSFMVNGFGKSSVLTSGNSSVDSFNSSIKDPVTGVPLSYAQQISVAPAAGGFSLGTAGAFHASPTGGSGNLGSDGSITVQGSYSIYGNLSPGPGLTVNGSPPLPKPSGLSGSVVPLSVPISLPDPTVMTNAPASGTPLFVNVSKVSFDNTYGGVPVTMPGLIASPPSVTGIDGQTKVYHVGSISSGFAVHGNVVIYLDGGVSLSGMHNFVSIYPNATLTIYQGKAGNGGFDVHGSPGFQQVDASGNSLAYQLPNIFNFISASSGAEGWHGNSDFAANVYAPFADVDFTGNGNRYGSVISNNLNIGGGSTLHIDLNAQSPVFAVPPGPPTISIGSMREVVPVGPNIYQPLTEK